MQRENFSSLLYSPLKNSREIKNCTDAAFYLAIPNAKKRSKNQCFCSVFFYSAILLILSETSVKLFRNLIFVKILADNAELNHSVADF